MLHNIARGLSFMAKNVQLTGNNITGVSGAQHGAQRNTAAMQRAGQSAGTTGAGITGNAGAYEFGTELGGQAGKAQLTGTNITGVSGAQHGASRNAQAMQRAARKSGQ
jgi:hypothetical protein